MSQTVSYETQRLDHLGIVAGICQEVGLAGVIDEQVGANGRQVSVGQATQAMILNGLGFSSRALYLTSEFFANKPVELLVGPGITAAMLNDDTLGRALDALYVKVRQRHRIVSQAVVIAIGVRRDGERAVLGFDVGPGEEEAFWKAFLRQLKERGLSGVQIVTSDAHNGLKKAVQAIFAGAAWQRCRVHFMRNLLARIPQRNKAVVAAALRTIFAQPDRLAAGQQLEGVAKALQPHWPAAAELLWQAADDVLAFTAFPEPHWRRIYSTNVLERLNKEIKHRTRVVEIFPSNGAVIRLVGAPLVEADEERQVQRRYFSQQSMRELYEPDLAQLGKTPPLPLAPVR